MPQRLPYSLQVTVCTQRSGENDEKGVEGDDWLGCNSYWCSFSCGLGIESVQRGMMMRKDAREWVVWALLLVAAVIVLASAVRLLI